MFLTSYTIARCPQHHTLLHRHKTSIWHTSLQHPVILENEFDAVINAIADDFPPVHNELPKRWPSDMSYEWENAGSTQFQPMTGMEAPPMLQPVQNMQWRQPQAIMIQQPTYFGYGAAPPMLQPIPNVQWQAQTIAPQQPTYFGYPAPPSMAPPMQGTQWQAQAPAPQPMVPFNIAAPPPPMLEAHLDEIIHARPAPAPAQPAPAPTQQFSSPPRQPGAEQNPRAPPNSNGRTRRAKAARPKTVAQCPQCPYKSANKEEMRRHTDSVHNGIRRHRCEVCQVNMNDPSGLSKHKKGKKHRAKVVALERAQGIFRTTKEIVWQCPRCKERGKESHHPRPDHLKRHLLDHCPYGDHKLPTGFRDGPGGMSAGRIEVVREQPEEVPRGPDEDTDMLDEDMDGIL